MGLAATALGLSVDPDDEAAYATTRMIFVELCPNPSPQFALAGPTVEQLAVDDIGFRTAAIVRRLLMEEAAPGAVLVNGIAAVSEFERLHRGQVDLTELRYPSVNGTRSLRHWEGVYASTHGSAPVVGFPFLRKPSAHNLYADIGQLGRRVRELRAGQHGTDHAGVTPWVWLRVRQMRLLTFDLDETLLDDDASMRDAVRLVCPKMAVLYAIEPIVLSDDFLELSAATGATSGVSLAPGSVLRWIREGGFVLRCGARRSVQWEKRRKGTRPIHLRHRDANVRSRSESNDRWHLYVATIANASRSQTRISFGDGRA